MQMKTKFAATLLVLIAVAFGHVAAQASTTAPDAATPVRTQAALLRVAQAGLSGTFEGRVDRFIIQGHQQQATRTYRLAINPDMVNATVWIHQDDKLLFTLVAKLRRQSNRILVGTTRPVEGKNYTPDQIKLEFAADGQSVRWYHNDNKMEGLGTLRRK